MRTATAPGPELASQNRISGPQNLDLHGQLPSRSQGWPSRIISGWQRTINTDLPKTSFARVKLCFGASRAQTWLVHICKTFYADVWMTADHPKPSCEGLKFVSGVSPVIENHRNSGLDDSEPSTRTIQKQVLKAWNCVLVRQWNPKWLVQICKTFYADVWMTADHPKPSCEGLKLFLGCKLWVLLLLLLLLT